ncbi:MAG: hypothetical protein A2284_03610 [Deltaproteobacteria bacterium RIFOXYA12_FULL_61_11]|nr:MAG: hypothetical protein A2284_03610 [Deltaproteobacteria bacterium RIFOXYA12_FULL_61_11]
MRTKLFKLGVVLMALLLWSCMPIDYDEPFFEAEAKITIHLFEKDQRIVISAPPLEVHSHYFSSDYTLSVNGEAIPFDEHRGYRLERTDGPLPKAQSFQVQILYQPTGETIALQADPPAAFSIDYPQSLKRLPLGGQLTPEWSPFATLDTVTVWIDDRALALNLPDTGRYELATPPTEPGSHLLHLQKQRITRSGELEPHALEVITLSSRTREFTLTNDLIVEHLEADFSVVLPDCDATPRPSAEVSFRLAEGILTSGLNGTIFKLALNGTVLMGSQRLEDPKARTYRTNFDVLAPGRRYSVDLLDPDDRRLFAHHQTIPECFSSIEHELVGNLLTVSWLPRDTEYRTTLVVRSNQEEVDPILRLPVEDLGKAELDLSALPAGAVFYHLERTSQSELSDTLQSGGFRIVQQSSLRQVPR